MKKVIAAVLLMFVAACSQIDTGNVGVESTLGQVKKESLPPGVYFTMFKRVVEVVAKESPLALNDMKPQTSDKITLADLDVDVYYQIDAGKAPDILTRWPGDLVQVEKEDGMRAGMNYVQRQAREAIYSAVAGFKSDVVHTKRTEIAAEVMKSLQTNLDAEAGKGWFFVRSVNIRNLVTDPALENQIKLAAQEQFKLQQEENRLKTARVEADRKRVEAQGAADAIRINAQAIAVQGGKEYVELKAIEKWDGKLPATMAGVVPFVNVK
jgi:regulator of protease activity HflC (stomatin/prohibitin superfamily)